MADNGLRGFFGKHFGAENVLWVEGEGPEPSDKELRQRAAEVALVTRRYKIERRNGRVFVRVKFRGPNHSGFGPLNPRHDLCNHSPDGFEFGYGGSGPAQLALAILADALGDDERALRLYQDFKRATVAQWKGDFIDITAETVRSIAADLEAKQEPSPDPFAD